MGIYWSIFLAFLRVGLFGYGGGPAMIPLIEREAVHTYGWMTPEEFIDVIAMANTLPGPLATKMAICIGLRTGGAAGAATALGAMLLPSTILIVIFTIVYYRYRNLASVQGIVRGVRPVVIALLMVTVAHLAPRSVMTWDTFLIALAAFALVFYLRIHPIYTIAVAALAGYLFYR
ncbi:MAG: chromate transporter [Candidatus Krumholzibacteriota bacterium]|nr:chromate transporter [Candidatus Krumholzibacteriota bacterium]